VLKAQSDEMATDPRFGPRLRTGAFLFPELVFGALSYAITHRSEVNGYSRTVYCDRVLVAPSFALLGGEDNGSFDC
jgi:hypothetical protein